MSDYKAKGLHIFWKLLTFVNHPPRTVKTPTLSSEPSPFAPWAVFVWTRSLSTSVSL